MLKKVIGAGIAYRKHVNIIEQALAEPDTQASSDLLQTYVTNLSPAAYAGFAMTVMRMAGGTKDQRRKDSLQALAQQAGAARTATDPVAPSRDPLVEGEVEADADVDVDPVDLFTERCYELKDEGQRMDMLLDLLLSLDRHGFPALQAKLESDRVVVLRRLREHEENEHLAWGRFVEDQIAYAMAKERTGGSDPRWLSARAEFQRMVAFYDWAIESATGAWEVIADKKWGD